MHESMTLSTFTLLCNVTIIHPQKFFTFSDCSSVPTKLHLHRFPFLPSPRQPTSQLLSVCLPALGTSRKWNLQYLYFNVRLIHFISKASML